VISSLKKTAPKSNLQLPSLNTDDDDTPPIHPSFLTSHQARGVSPPKFSDVTFNASSLIDDSEVVQILSEADQVNFKF
jgi:hypothetical protein